MRNSLKYLVLFAVVFTSCETVYIPKLDEVEAIITVDARLVMGGQDNKIEISKSIGFSEKGYYFPSLIGAEVQMIDDQNNVFQVVETENGIYSVGFQIEPDRKYKLKISAEGETYESEFEAAPELPNIDTLYSEQAEKLLQPGGETSVDDFDNTVGHQFYVDIDNNNESKFYRFYARKILQYYFSFDTIMFGEPVVAYKYGWKSIFPQGSFNVAGAAKYSSSNNIYKHPVEFFGYREEAYLDTGQIGFGRIYIIHQYGIPKSGYNFYNDLNSQLDADGKIFDPLYIQARSNLRCISDPNKIILGNFEIASYRESRYYLRLDPRLGKHVLHKIDVFHDISMSGIKSLVPPYFWEH